MPTEPTGRFMQTAPPSREHWASRLGFVLAAAGSAVGLGNVWKFPYVAGENGGGTFLLLYIAIIASLGLSILLAELVVGHAGQANPVGALRRLGRGAWPLVGWLGITASFLILSFYGVVAGWTLAFALKAAFGSAIAPGADAEAAFAAFVSDPAAPLVSAAAFMAATVVVVTTGVRRGIERASLILMPLLFVMLVVLVVRALTLPGAAAGLAAFLTPDLASLTGTTITAALGQAFFSLSIGLGTMITYGSYLPRDANVVGEAAAVVGLDTLAALLAGLVVLPSVFAFGLAPDAGPGLAFITLPTVFAQMPAGAVFGTVFFVLLTIAALTSAVSLLEPIVAYCAEEHGLGRRRAAVALGAIIFALGVPSSLSMGVWSEHRVFGLPILELIDFVTANIMLPVGGLFIALFVGWVVGRKGVERHFARGPRARIWGRAWLWTLRLAAPIAIVWILLSGLGVHG
jgi:NSS family neurotransmitter:Na+ symporter